jgi:hypothetical protein
VPEQICSSEDYNVEKRRKKQRPLYRPLYVPFTAAADPPHEWSYEPLRDDQPISDPALA